MLSSKTAQIQAQVVEYYSDSEVKKWLAVDKMSSRLAKKVKRLVSLEARINS